MWKRFYSVTKRGKFDPLIEQHVNQKLFEDMLRTHLQVPQAEASNGSTIQLLEVGENIMLLGTYPCLCLGSMRRGHLTKQYSTPNV